MAFRKLDGNRHENDIVGLIDVVFILLIFFLVTIATGGGGQELGDHPLNLPAMKGQPAVRSFSTLTFVIDADADDRPDARPTRVLALFPDMVDDQPIDTSLDAKIYDVAQDPDNPRFYLLDSPEEELELGEWVGEQIRRYWFMRRSVGERPTYIGVSAIQGTPYRLIEAVFDNCHSEAEGIDIPEIAFRTISR